MLSNVQVEELAKRMNIPLVFCDFKDMLPKKIQPNKSYVINLEDADDPVTGEANGGSHWTCFQVQKCGNGKLRGVYFDSFGMPPPEAVKYSIKHSFPSLKMQHSTKNVQSMMNSACGYYCLAFLHFVNSPHSVKDIEQDAATFQTFFKDLDKESDFKFNEFMLKHFFEAKDEDLRNKRRKEGYLNVLPDPEKIVSDKQGGLP